MRRSRPEGSSRLIAVGNLKGGTGKSTVSINLGAALGQSGLATVIIDTDPQRTGTLWAEFGELPAAVADFPLRDLASAGEWIEELDILSRRYERLIVDLPAVVSPVLASAFLIADLILIPSSVSEVDVQATRRTLRHIAIARRERPHNPPRTLIVPTQVRRGWFNDGGVDAQLASLGEPLSTPVRFDKSFSTAFKSRQWVGDCAPGSSGHRDILELMRHVERVLAQPPSNRRAARGESAEERRQVKATSPVAGLS